MGKHDNYGKRLFSEDLGKRWDPGAPEMWVKEAGVRAELDGVILSSDTRPRHVKCAVEIEARVHKQIRGAIVDLALHPAPKKLLVIIPAQLQVRRRGCKTNLDHCNHVWNQITYQKQGQFWVVYLAWPSDPSEDKKKINDTLGGLSIPTHSTTPHAT